ncbi:ATP synthase subunit O, mitochondrial isoform X3 [Gallus gallus]|uniref:ATP synthase subunit O, mitochondrial isoform X3 n=1 Tax=Gallus gallus TaxID=9031 RepID=UPI0003503C80|nr:ATP synthase subunit O, mitochondrial isoform X3 [Gallus gallus]|eukprot:XP_416717.4 ATP synthase subunit O, mitochondrial [Gallus gallus]
MPRAAGEGGNGGGASTAALAHCLAAAPGRSGDLERLWEKMAAAGFALKVRQLSTSAARPVSKLVKPPIQVYGLEGRYATALYSAATKQKKLEQVEKELGRVWTLLKDPKLASIVMNPHTKGTVKQKAVNDALAKEKMTPITINLMNLLAENGRLRYTPGIVSAFGKIMSAFRGEVLCTVTTAQPLDEASLTELKSALNGFLAKGEVLKLETKTDPSVLGGMIVNIGEKYVDMSTRSKIQKLTKIMKETV